jgi:hypothetical protein
MHGVFIASVVMLPVAGALEHDAIEHIH